MTKKLTFKLKYVYHIQYNSNKFKNMYDIIIINCLNLLMKFISNGGLDVICYISHV